MASSLPAKCLVGLCFSLTGVSMTAGFMMSGTSFVGRIDTTSSISHQRTKAACQTNTVLSLSSVTALSDGVVRNGSNPEDSGGEESTKIPKNPALLDLNQELNRWAETAGDAPDFQSSIEAAKRAEGLWLQAIDEHPENVDVVSYNTVLKAWSRCSHRLADFRYGFADSSANVNSNEVREVGTSLPPCTKNVDIYTPKDAVLRAQDWLFHPPAASSQEEHTLEPDTQSYNIVMDAWSKSRDPKGPQQVEHLFQRLQEHTGPDSLSYNALIDAYAYAPRGYPHRLDKVLQIWNHMKDLHKKGAEDVKPSFRTVNSVLHAYSRVAQQETEQALELAQDATKILEQVEQEATEEEDQPDVMTYTSVMECWSRAARMRTKPSAPQVQAEILLKKLQKRAAAATTEAERERLTPNIYTYTTLIKTWARAPYRYNAVAKCEDLLEKLFAAAASSDDTPVAADDGVVYPPVNAVACTAVLQAYGRSNDPNKATKALELLQRMRNSGFPPTLVSYNTALDTCARTRGTAQQQTAAIKIAFAIFKTIQMKKDEMTANHVTFGSLLHAVGYLMPPSEERNAVTKACFSKAVAAGQVDGSVLINLQKACDAEVYRELLGQGTNRKLDLNKLPPSWSRNVRTGY